MRPRIRIRSDQPIGAGVHVEVWMGEGWQEIPVTRAEVTLVPDDVSRVSFDVLCVQTDVEAVVSEGTLDVLKSILVDNGYSVTGGPGEWPRGSEPVPLWPSARGDKGYERDDAA